jgi:hypothetical protein
MDLQGTHMRDHDANTMVRKTLTLMLTIVLTLVGCEAGLYFGISPNDDPPSVSLAATATSVAPGERIGLVAAASDDFRVDDVSFYRVESNGGSTLLARDSSEPYSVETVLPSGEVGTVQFFARARDDAGQERDSTLVSVTVR